MFMVVGMSQCGGRPVDARLLAKVAKLSSKPLMMSVSALKTKERQTFVTMSAALSVVEIRGVEPLTS